MRNTKQYIYKTKYVLIQQFWTYTNAYIDIGSRCMYKGHFNRTVFIKAREAQSVQHQATNLKVVGSSPM